MQLKHTIAAIAATLITAQGQFVSVAELEASNQAFIKAADDPRTKAAIVVNLVNKTADGDAVAREQLLAREDVREVLAAGAQHAILGPELEGNMAHEGITRLWLKTQAGQIWAASHAAKVAPYLSRSLYQHVFLSKDYRVKEDYDAWKASGFQLPLGEIAQPESIAVVAAKHEDWATISGMDRSKFTYRVFSYPSYSRWAKAVAQGKTIQEQYDFIQSELITVGATGTPGSLVICQHLNALSTMMFNMMRQGAALQNP